MHGPPSQGWTLMQRPAVELEPQAVESALPTFHPARIVSPYGKRSLPSLTTNAPLETIFCA